ncbi:MAG: hypothetical protein AB1758_25860 [Candidatus Eremiobacterota bacterium]
MKKNRPRRFLSSELPIGLNQAVSGSWKAVSESRKARGDLPFRMAGPGRTRTLSERELARQQRLARTMESEELPTDLERAQELVYEAWERPPEQRSDAALKALVLSPRCADAYLLLADLAPTARERLQLCRQAVVAGQAALRDSLDPDADLWTSLRARPYLRARAAYGRALWDLGELGQAAGELRELARLNPADNLGLRYLMLPLLIQLGEQAEAEALLEHWAREPSPEWDFNRALLACWRHGPAGKPREILKRGMHKNPHVALYLLGLNPLPRRLPEAITFGCEDEAIDYTARAHGAWTAVPGALDWLARVAEKAVS